jgi:hypothetical protein
MASPKKRFSVEQITSVLQQVRSRSVFVRYDITSEEDLAEPSRKLDAGGDNRGNKLAIGRRRD